MQVDYQCIIRFTENELKEALLSYMGGELNNLIINTPEWKRQKQIIDHLQNNHCVMEWFDGLFCIGADGNVKTEKF